MISHYIYCLRSRYFYFSQGGWNFLCKRNTIQQAARTTIVNGLMKMNENSHNARPYQIEILDKAKKENTIVCLGTGTGKTFISVMLIREKQHEIQKKISDGGRRTFFLVNTVPLAEQQAQAIRNHTTLKVKAFTGDMNVDSWDRNRWIREFNENDVLVMTAQILVDILTHNFFNICNMNLLILDECHNASKKHPYVRVMERFVDAKKSGGPLPLVMGLTASIINEKYKRAADDYYTIRNYLDQKMKELECTLRAKCITCSDPEGTSKYATKPAESIVVYEEGYDAIGFHEIDRMIISLKEKLEEHASSFEKRKKHMSQLRMDSQDYLRGNMFRMSQRDACLVAHDTLKYIIHVLDKLGPLCAHEASCILKEQLGKEEFKCKDSSVFGECREILEYIISSYIRAVGRGLFKSVENVVPIQPFITRKAHKFLEDILLSEKRQFQSNYGKELHAIVFTERRCTAVILSKLINRIVKADPAYEGIISDYVLGHGAEENIRLADSYMKSTRQSSILNRFKSGEFNVLLSTSVVEEGLDVRKCNLVVRFDGIANYRQYVQSKGRARSSNSRFIVMTEQCNSADMEKQLKVMQNIERVLFSKCQDRELPTEDEIDGQMRDVVTELIPTILTKGGFARIHHYASIPLLFRYCAKLPHDSYTNNTPYIQINKRGSKDLVEYQAQCTLPANFPLEPRRYTSDWFMNTMNEKGSDLAKKQVCSAICQRLLYNNELTEENLLPVVRERENYAEELSSMKEEKLVEGTRKNRSFYRRKIPNSMDKRCELSECDLYAISILLSQPYSKHSCTVMWPFWYGDVKEGFGIFLPKDVNADKLPNFNLYTKKGGYSVGFIKLPRLANTITKDKEENIKKYHSYVSQRFFKPYIYGDIIFDDLASNISKGYLVPLKSSVFDDIVRDRDCCNTSPVDYERITKTLNFKECDDFDHEQPVIQKTYVNNKRAYYVLGRSETNAEDLMDGSITFSKYYKSKYGITLHPNTSFLMAINPKAESIQFGENEEWAKDKHPELRYNVAQLPRELCELASGMTAQHHLQAVFLPYVFYKMESLLNADELKRDLARKLHLKTDTNVRDVDISKAITNLKIDHDSGFGDLSHEIKRMKSILRSSQWTSFPSPTTLEVFEATTTRQASFDVDLERLEMLGDAFLKQAVSVYLFFKHPSMNEGKLTLLRKASVSNKNLCDVARRIKLEEYLNNSRFGLPDTGSEHKNPLTIWLPFSHRRTLSEEKANELLPIMEQKTELQSIAFQEVQDKSIADCVEALIGLYFMTGGVNLALQFMSHLKIPSLYKEHENTITKEKSTSKSLYADFPMPASAVANDSVTQKEVENLYRKGNFDKLERKIHYNFSDKSHLIRAMTHPSYYENVATRAYQEYEYLGDSILDFLVTLHVYCTSMKQLTPGEMTSLKASLVNNNVFSFYAIQLDLHKFVFLMSPSFMRDCDEFVSMVEENTTDGEMKDLFESPFVVVPPGSEEGFVAPKVLGDLIESLAGAIFLDSGLDLIKVWQVFYPIMQPIIEKYMKDIPLAPKRQLHETYLDAKFEFPDTASPGESFRCVIRYGNGKQETGLGKNKKIAAITASYRVMRKEKEQGEQEADQDT